MASAEPSKHPGAWVKGVSGNPGGRPRREGQIRALAQVYSARVLKRLFVIATTANHLPSAVAAANAILDRAYGRPHAALHVSAELNLGPESLDLARLTIDELRAFRELLGKAQPAVIDVTPEKAAEPEPKANEHEPPADDRR